MVKKIFICAFTLILSLSLIGCSGGGNKEINLSDVMGEIEKSCELDSSMSEITLDDLNSLYGIKSADIVQFEGKITNLGTIADEIIMLEATNDTAADVKAKVEQRYQTKENEMKDYLPEEYAKIKNCEVTQSGNYICMFISKDAASMQAIFEEAAK